MYEGRVLVAHWFNGSWGWGRRVIKLFRNTDVPLGQDGAWTLYVAMRQDLEDEFPYRTEARVRADIEILLTDCGPWSLVGGTEREEKRRGQQLAAE